MEIRKKYNNNIEVSNLWNIKRNWKISKQTESCWYNYIKIDWKKIWVHRLVACCFLWLNILDKKSLVCHKNDIRNDNRIENLFIWTSYDNVHDMINKWRKYILWLPWSRHPNHKIHEIDIIIIRCMYRNWIWTKNISKHYWMSIKSIYNICHWRSRKHIK